jgi:Trk K+ transport system NAD-binding subunit
LLPNWEGAVASFENVREYLVEMLVQIGCELIGHTVEKAGLRHLPGLFLMEIERSGEVIPVESPNTMIYARDRLVFAGAVESVVELRRIYGLEVSDDQAFKLEHSLKEHRLFEAVISAESPAAGKSLRDARFRHPHQKYAGRPRNH